MTQLIQTTAAKPLVCEHDQDAAIGSKPVLEPCLIAEGLFQITAVLLPPLVNGRLSFLPPAGGEPEHEATHHAARVIYEKRKVPTHNR